MAPESGKSGSLGAPTHSRDLVGTRCGAPAAVLLSVRHATPASGKPLGNPPAPKWPTPDGMCVPEVWDSALRVVDRGWVVEERLADVVAWLAAHWRDDLVLDDELRAALNEGLAPAAPIDTEPDVRDWVPTLIAHVQRATGLKLYGRLREVIALGVVDSMLVLDTDTGRGRRIADSNRIAYARDENCKYTGGVRAALARNPGVHEWEARKVALLLLGTTTLDVTAYPHREGQLGASGALVSSVLKLPVTLSTALAWAHAATRAAYPDIGASAMRAMVSRPLRARFAALPTGVLPAPASEQQASTRPNSLVGTGPRSDAPG